MATVEVETHCPYCALPCGMTLRGDSEHGPVEVRPREFPTNRAASARRAGPRPNCSTTRPG